MSEHPQESITHQISSPSNRRRIFTEKNLIHHLVSFHLMTMYIFFLIIILLLKNKLKSLKVAQVKDEMDGGEDDGCDGVCDVVW